MARMILGRKLGMTQIFDANGKVTPVTVVQVGPMVVVAKRHMPAQGYYGIKVGFEPAKRQEKDGDVRFRGLTKADVGVFTAAGIDAPCRVLREFRVTEAEFATYEVGQILDHTMFSAGNFVDVIGTSRGRGFSGVMKRHNFAGFGNSHGAHESFRGGGSIGSSAFPARVFPGKKMPGQYGNARVTTQNLRLVRVIAEDNLYLIKGAVPGSKSGLVAVRVAVKKSR
jgi:large subunit ribosomal protein L3